MIYVLAIVAVPIVVWTLIGAALKIRRHWYDWGDTVLYWRFRPTTAWAPFIGIFFLLPEWCRDQAPDPDYSRIMVHERVHEKQIAKHGAWFFYTRWAFDKHWRLLFEAEAYAESVKWWGDTSRLDYYAQMLSGYWFSYTPAECKTAIARFL